VHFLWLVKGVEAGQITYAGILTGLLGLPLWWAIAPRPAPPPPPPPPCPPADLPARLGRLLILRRDVQFRSLDRTPGPGRSQAPEVPIEEAVLHDSTSSSIPFLAWHPDGRAVGARG